MQRPECVFRCLGHRSSVDRVTPQRSPAYASDQPAVLAATDTYNLAEVLAGQLKELAGPGVAEAVAVVNLDSLAARILSRR